MDIAIDTSVLLAVVLDAPERTRVVELTAGHSLVGPGSIPWEVGNAFSAMLKQQRLSISEAQKGMEISLSIPVRYASADFSNALALADKLTMYACDAYVLDCALRHNCPLLTLDIKLQRQARKLGIAVLEV